MILKDIIQSLKADAHVKKVMKGIFWTAVASKYCGLASTMIYESCFQEDKDNLHFSSLTDKTVLELAQYVFSNRISDVSIGLAAINSLIDINESRCKEVNAGDLLIKLGEKKNVSVIGHFPFSDALKSVTNNLWVIEKRVRPGDYPERDAEIYLPQSDIIAISSTTLINHTLDAILKLCPKRSIKILLGPSTPMSEIIFDYGIDIISGIKVLDEVKVFKYISEGANFRQLKKTGAIMLITMARKEII
ncbi:MAG TPA: DUF364 domain-containing protein [Syntrophorhabdaceae bacterium]|nr:DUF364 domain-containing protein [Syntrophorhabdaceae bacterium]